jgi:hypothetical protein
MIATASEPQRRPGTADVPVRSQLEVHYREHDECEQVRPHDAFKLYSEDLLQETTIGIYLVVPLVRAYRHGHRDGDRASPT